MNLKLFFISLFFILFSSNVSSFVHDSVYHKDVYYQKLQKINSKIPIFYNDQVKISINQLIKNTNNSTSILLGKTDYYYQKYASVFEENEIPKQLFLMIASNSQCNNAFVDTDGASGMWAISYAIAKKYNLITNSYVDERRNMEKSTIAATEYLVDLNLIYKDWLKSLVAFRIGPINMNMAIHKSLKSLDYNTIHGNLSSEHQMVASNFMAFWYIWNYHNEHKIHPIKFKLPETDTVHVKNDINLNIVASQINMPFETLKLLNPELRLDIMPFFYNKGGLKLPLDKIQLFKDSINVLFPNKNILINFDTILKDSIFSSKDTTILKITSGEKVLKNEINYSKNTTIIYTVKKGDGLLLIADVFDCKISEIKKWNNMKNDKIFAGQKLKIEIPESKLSYYKKIDKMSITQKRNLTKK
jgi:membrane-bound lytic murein transglycosylase D